MNLKQRLLQTIYPLIMWLSSFKNKAARIKINTTKQIPLQPIYNLKATSINKGEFPLAGMKGKKIMFVNTASDCGFTNQYKELEKLYKNYNGGLVIMGFPANDFQQQEAGTNEAIASFCSVNFGVSFPLMQKSVVIKKDNQNEIFKWLTDANKNGWNNQAPLWNFTKYLVNEEGILTHYFDSSVSPLSKDVLQAIG